jgi:CDP-diacylglycerol--serine O-phosphatidyltransferase
MADLITSGLAPGMVMYKLFLETGVREIDINFILLRSDFTFSFAPYALIGFLIPLGAGIRLANFNIDTGQRFEFRGLPAPANALFIVSFPLLLEHPLLSGANPFLASYQTLIMICLVSALIMNIRLPLFSFKINSLNFQEYGYQLVLLLFVFPSFYFFQWVAVPLLIIIYLILNVIRNSFN